MITFSTNEFKNEVIRMLDYYEKHNLYFEFHNLDDIDNPDIEEEIIISEETFILIGLPDSDDTFDVTLIEALRYIKEVEEAIYLNDSRYITKDKVLIRVEFISPEIIEHFEQETFKQNFELNGKKYNIDIVGVEFVFGLAVVVYGEYDDYLPPIFNDSFIEIKCELGNIEKDEIDQIYNAYIFEINATLDLGIHESPRPELYEPYENLQNTSPKMRQMILAEGTSEILKLFNAVTCGTEPEIQILYYSKVVEFVSQTVIKQELIETVLNKLNTKRALEPNAGYVFELERIFEEQRSYRKDNESLRLTIEKCCDISEIVEKSPQYLKKIRQIHAKSSKEDRIEALYEFSNAMSDTRNMLAHAKTNYTRKGKECPNEQMHDFANCCRIIAIQVIRWYARQHETMRIE